MIAVLDGLKRSLLADVQLLISAMQVMYLESVSGCRDFPRLGQCFACPDLGMDKPVSWVVVEICKKKNVLVTGSLWSRYILSLRRIVYVYHFVFFCVC